VADKKHIALALAVSLKNNVFPFLLLQPVRCEHCYHRSCLWRSIPALERDQPERKQSQNQPPSGSKSDGRVA